MLFYQLNAMGFGLLKQIYDVIWIFQKHNNKGGCRHIHQDIEKNYFDTFCRGQGVNVKGKQKVEKNENKSFHHRYNSTVGTHIATH